MIITAAAAHVTHVSQFWPTLTRVLTAVAAISGSVAGIVGGLNRKHLFEVKSTVNGQFTAKVEEVAQVSQELRDVTAQLAIAHQQLANIGQRKTDGGSTP